MNEIDGLMVRVARLDSAGSVAREAGDEPVAEEYFHGALDLALEAAKKMAKSPSPPARLEVLRTAARLALDSGEVAEAKRLLAEVLTFDPFTARADGWAQLRDTNAWPDTWLIAAVRRDPPDPEALDTLVERYWKALFGRCQILTVNHENANDLAQETWYRVLRGRHALKPGGNFPAYLATIATNLWRDRHRSARRAGALADDRLLALDAGLPGEEGGSISLRDVLPDLNALDSQQQALLALDIDKALERLTPQQRDVLVGRFLTGESCAEIGRRYGRTEQTISSWVRAAVREMRLYFEAENPPLVAKEGP